MQAIKLQNTPVHKVWGSCIFVFLTMLLCVPACHAACDPSFPLQPGRTLGWQGADAAYSIPLPDGRDVWIFGDTLYGPQRVVNGHDPRQVHNSLGISTCHDGVWKLNYIIRHNTAGQAESFFSPANPQHWYWALDGFYARGQLWVTLLCIRHAPSTQPWAMGFETCGSDLAQISHLDRDPQQWQVKVHPLVSDGVKAYPSATAVVHDGYAYLFASYEHGARPLLATRVPLSGLDDPAKHLEYLAADGSWKAGFDPAKAKEIMAHGATELTIRYHPELHEWLAVMFAPEGFSDKVITRTAPSLTGPWSEGSTIYHVPEMQPGPARDPSVFCYAGKEHPELETGGKLVFTYVCNTIDVPGLLTHLNIYHPQVVQVPMAVGRSVSSTTSSDR